MATVDAISGTASGTTSSSKGGLGALTSEDFAKLIFTELGKQDPLQPSDTKALIDQISSLRSIESNMDLTSQLGKLVSQNEFASAATLIGKRVSGVTDSDARASGTVKSVLRTSDGAVVQLTSGDKINIANLDEIVDAATTNGAGSGA